MNRTEQFLKRIIKNGRNQLINIQPHAFNKRTTHPLPTFRLYDPR